jgi:deoxyribonuclease V
MIFCVDVHYGERVVTACVGVKGFGDADPALELVEETKTAAAPYQPGRFYERELPFLVEILARARTAATFDVVIIDGHVWLAEDEPGLGAHLSTALGKEIVIIGVAKSRFSGGVAVPVLRGRSRQPLYVTAAGMDVARAAELVATMHGPYRIPTILKRVDQLARRIAPT